MLVRGWYLEGRDIMLVDRWKLCTMAFICMNIRIEMSQLGPFSDVDGRAKAIFTKLGPFDNSSIRVTLMLMF